MLLAAAGGKLSKCFSGYAFECTLGFRRALMRTLSCYLTVLFASLLADNVSGGLMD